MPRLTAALLVSLAAVAVCADPLRNTFDPSPPVDLNQFECSKYPTLVLIAIPASIGILGCVATIALCASNSCAKDKEYTEHFDVTLPAIAAQYNSIQPTVTVTSTTTSYNVYGQVLGRGTETRNYKNTAQFGTHYPQRAACCTLFCMSLAQFAAWILLQNSLYRCDLFWTTAINTGITAFFVAFYIGWVLGCTGLHRLSVVVIVMLLHFVNAALLLYLLIQHIRNIDDEENNRKALQDRPGWLTTIGAFGFYPLAIAALMSIILICTFWRLCVLARTGKDISNTVGIWGRGGLAASVPVAVDSEKFPMVGKSYMGGHLQLPAI